MQLIKGNKINLDEVDIISNKINTEVIKECNFTINVKIEENDSDKIDLSVELNAKVIINNDNISESFISIIEHDKRTVYNIKDALTIITDNKYFEITKDNELEVLNLIKDLSEKDFIKLYLSKLLDLD